MRHHQERGTTLVEVLIAAAILLVGIVPLLRVFLYELEMANRANKTIIATNLARDMAEEIRAQYFAEEFANYTSNRIEQVWPNSDTVVQTFGRETGETNMSQAYITSNGGRIQVFDDVDDYDGWCRGPVCGDDSIVETFDGNIYNGTGGYPNYVNTFSREVLVRNIFPNSTTEHRADRFAAWTSILGDVPEFERYFFENWSTMRINPSTGLDTTGRSTLKIIEVTVTVEGRRIAQEIKEVTFSVMPIARAAGMGN